MQVVRQQLYWIPILCGALIPLIPFKSRTQMAVYVECVVLINSLLVLDDAVSSASGCIRAVSLYRKPKRKLPS